MAKSSVSMGKSTETDTGKVKISKLSKMGHKVRGARKFVISPPHKVAAPSFWLFAVQLSGLTESERIEKIHSGFEASLLQAFRAAFDVSKALASEFANISTATLDRRLKANNLLDRVASERLDRLSQIAVMAAEVFESREIASKWLSTPNQALGGVSPLSLCLTELGAGQVKRVLHAIEWGGAV